MALSTDQSTAALAPATTTTTITTTWLSTPCRWTSTKATLSRPTRVTPSTSKNNTPFSINTTTTPTSTTLTSTHTFTTSKPTTPRPAHPTTSSWFAKNSPRNSHASRFPSECRDAFARQRLFVVALLALLTCSHFGVCLAAAETETSPTAAPTQTLEGDAGGGGGGRGGGGTGQDAQGVGGGGGGVVMRRIKITRRQRMQLNGVEVDENSLLAHLAEHERELIFGRTDAKSRAIKLVHLSSSQTAQQQLPVEEERDGGNATSHGRSKRAADDAANVPAEGKEGRNTAADEVAVQIQDADFSLRLHVRPTPRLIDDAFVFIRRYANTSQLVADSQGLAERYERCFYSNAHAALDLCDEEQVRGLFRHNASDFIIHPLPARFGSAAHIIIERERDAQAEAELDVEGKGAVVAPPIFDEHLQFEPDEADFNEVNVRQMADGGGESTEASTRATRNAEEFLRHGALSPSERYPHAHSGATSLHLRYQPRRHKTRPRTHQQPPGGAQSGDKQRSARSSHQHHHNHQHQHETNHHRRRRRRRYISSYDEDNNNRDNRDNNNNNGSGKWPQSPQVLHIETAIFVDSDLYRHMSKNFPHATETHLMRFVLAMINGVQLLYQHPSLGHRVNFVLKRLEILASDPADLRRSSDIDTYLSNFCMWQNKLNSRSDDVLHYDHALILTGLDLYVINQRGQLVTQVVGLAPVAGMCTPTSSCTINEGKHFESVFVVAHEIGHNLGMRHDTKDINCDPSLHIMSPTLGSGKITWSKCSRNYLNDFLRTKQANCLFNRGQFAHNLDHSAEGLLPGERFEADQQCMLKYGRDSVRARTQTLSDVCRDLHCQRERYTWTSHPALEGTECGDNMWCRSGVCVLRPTRSAPQPATNSNTQRQALATAGGRPGYDGRSNFVESGKMGQLMQEYSYNNRDRDTSRDGNNNRDNNNRDNNIYPGSSSNNYNTNRPASWGDWGEASACDSGCLYGPSKRLREGSTGLRTYTRQCLDYRRRCMGRDRRFESCIAKQCYSVPITTIDDFARQVCEKAQKFDAELTGEGQQLTGNIEDACKIHCKTKSNATKSRSWTFPDGTTCRANLYGAEDTAYCIAGRCEKFSCDNSTKNYYQIDGIFCAYRQPARVPTDLSISSEADSRYQATTYRGMAQRTHNRYPTADSRGSGSEEGSRSGESNRSSGPPTAHSKYENEVAMRSMPGPPPHQQQQQSSSSSSSPSSALSQQEASTFKRKVDPYQGYAYHKYNYHPKEIAPSHQQPPASASLVALTAYEPTAEWLVRSGCHSSCMAKSRGIQVVASRRNGANNIQLCSHTVKPCEHLLSATEFAENTCARYKLKVRGLSGFGTQIAASIDEPDRSCRVGCQDEYIKYRYYLVNGKYGHFPLGTRCSSTEERYCVNGKCLPFGPDGLPLEESHISLALFRNRRQAAAAMEREEEERNQRSEAGVHRRRKRSFLYYEPVNITERITQDFINSIVNSIIDYERRQQIADQQNDVNDHIEFANPIHIASQDGSTQSH